MTPRPFLINLSSRPRLYVAPIRAGLVLGSLLLLCLGAWDLQEVHALRAQAVELEQRVAHVHEQDRRFQAQAMAESLDLSEPTLEKLPQGIAFANQLIAKRAFSWTHFLYDLEDVVPAGVAMSTIKLDVKNSSIAMGGSAIGLKELTSLIISLEDHAAFKDAVLAQHHVMDSGLVDFNLTVRYRPQQ